MPKSFLLFLLVSLSCYASNLPQEIGFKEAKRIYTAGSGLFIDARGTKFYKQGTILGALNMPMARFMRMKRMLPLKKGSKLVIFCNGIQCEKSAQLAQKIAALGYSRVMVYRGGFPEWREKGQEIMLAQKYCQAANSPKREATIQGVKVYLGRDEGMIDAAWFTAQFKHGSIPKNMVLVDVRRTKDFKKGHMPNALHIRWDGDEGVIDSSKFPKDKLILFYCNTGLLSSDAYDSLDEEIAKNVLFLDAQVKCKDKECTIKPN